MFASSSQHPPEEKRAEPGFYTITPEGVATDLRRNINPQITAAEQIFGFPRRGPDIDHRAGPRASKRFERQVESLPADMRIAVVAVDILDEVVTEWLARHQPARS